MKHSVKSEQQLTEEYQTHKYRLTSHSKITFYENRLEVEQKNIIEIESNRFLFDEMYI